MAVAVAGYGYAALTAADQVYTGCLDKGTISDVAVGTTPAKACGKKALQISWNQQGPAGTNGVSVTSAAEPAGANCANGGSKFTSASGVTYACNGAKGDAGSGSGAACTRSVGDAGTVATYVTLEESVLLSCETASGPQTLAFSEAIANEAADAFIGQDNDVRDVPVTPVCVGAYLVACPGGQPVNPPVTLHVTNYGTNYFTRGQASYDVSNTLLVKTNQPIPVTVSGLDGCSLNIDTSVGGIDTVDEATLRWDITQGLTGFNRIHYDSNVIGLDAEDFSGSGGVVCSPAVAALPIGFVQAVISNSLRDQGPLCGAPGPDLFMRCPN